MRVLNFIILILSLVAIEACTPSGSQVPTCESGSIFDTKSRGCRKMDNPTVGRPKNVGVAEDSNTTFAIEAGFGKTTNLQYFIQQDPQHGTLTDCMDQSGSTAYDDLECTYTPDPDYSGSDQFTYKSFDGNSFSLKDGIVYITVTSSPDNPTTASAISAALDANPAYFTMAEDTTVTFVLPYSDSEGDLAKKCQTTSKVNISAGTCSCDVLGVCSVALTPPTNYNSYRNNTTTFSFQYQLNTDGSSTYPTTSETIYITVTNTVDAPTSSITGCSTAKENSLYTCTPVLSDPDLTYGNLTRTYASASADTCSWLKINSSTGVLTGTPGRTDVGTCTLKIAITEGGTTVESDIKSLAITASNFITIDSVHIDQNSLAYTALTNANVAHSSEGSGAVYSLTTTTYFTERSLSISPCSTSYGTVTISSTTGQVTFTPTSGLYGDCYIAVRSLGSGFDDRDFVTIHLDRISWSSCAQTYEDNPISCAPTVDSAHTATDWTYSVNSTTCNWSSGPTISTSGVITGTPGTGDTACNLKVYTKHSGSSTNVSHTISMTPQSTIDFISATPTAVTEGASSTQILSNSQVTADSTYSSVTYSYGDFGADFAETSCNTYGTITIASGGAISFDPNNDFSGTCTIGVKFTSSTIVGYDEIDVTVTDIADPPSFSSLSWSSKSIYSGEPVSLTFKLDEGDGLFNDINSIEQLQQVYLSVSSSNTSLLPASNITMSSSGGTTATGAGSITIDSTATDDAGSKTVTLDMIPISGVSGSTTITFTATDSSGLSSTTSVTLTIGDAYASFVNWTSIVAYGARYYHDQVAADPSVTLKWADMTVYKNGSVYTNYTWNVYRLDNASYLSNFINSRDENNHALVAVNTSSIAKASRTFTDTTVTPGKQYYYIVKPVDATGSLAIPLANASAPYVPVEVIVPPDNMALVHHWMANIQMCAELKDAGVAGNTDKLNNYRCTYAGPLNTGGYFDLNRHIFVDIVEAGCPYDRAPSCNVSTGCIGAGAPTNGGTITTNTSGIYYDREDGSCYFTSDSGTSWNSFSALGSYTPSLYQITTDYIHLPPLVNIGQSKAAMICDSVNVRCDGANCSATDSQFSSTTYKRLMTRVEQVISSAWDTQSSSLLSDSTINNIEIGGALNTSHYCNSTLDGSDSNGLTYFDGNFPLSISMIDTLPFTSSSALRSVRTGSASTASCVSFFGIQDMVGNVREWAADAINCSAADCQGDFTTVDGKTNATAYGLNTVDYGYLADFSGIAPDFTYNPVDPMSYLFSAKGTDGINGRYFAPLLGYSISTAEAGAYDITLATFDFHGDQMLILAPNNGGNHALSYGGSWNDATYDSSGSKAGRYTADFLPPSTEDVDIGFRCVTTLPSTPP